MANKYRKIKRYKIHYKRRRKRNNILKTILFVILILVLVFLAYSVAGPIKKLLSGELTSSDSSSQSFSSAVSSSSSSQTVPSEPEQPPVSETAIKAVTMPLDIVLDTSKQQAFLTQAKQDGYTAVMAPLKDEEGKIYFQSSVTAINGKRAVVSNAVNAEALVKAIKDAGLTPIAAINTFKDKTAPDKAKNNTFMVENSTYTWFDRAADDGGKPWLDPSREAARSYLTTIIEDLAKAGFSEIVLQTVHLPEINDMEKSDFAPGVPISEILSQFISEAGEAAGRYDTKVSVSYQASAYWSAKAITYGGEAGAIKSDRISPVIRLADYGAKLIIGETVIENPSADPAAAANAILTLIRAKTSAQDPEIVPILASDQNNEPIIAALQALGIESYIIA